MKDREKRWFICLEIEGRKAKSSSAWSSSTTQYQRTSKTTEPSKTSTPIRAAFKPDPLGFGNTFKKRFGSGGTRKI